MDAPNFCQFAARPEYQVNVIFHQSSLRFPCSFLETQMYFKLLSVHSVAMTSVVSNPLLYFWMSKVRQHCDVLQHIIWFLSETPSCVEGWHVLADKCEAPSAAASWRLVGQIHTFTLDWAALSEKFGKAFTAECGSQLQPVQVCAAFPCHVQ